MECGLEVQMLVLLVPGAKMTYLFETLRFHDFCLKIIVNSAEQSVDVICRIACSLGNNLFELRMADVGVVVSKALLPKALSSAVIWGGRRISQIQNDV